MHDHAHRETEEAVKLAHPFGVALGEIIVDGDDMHAASAERVEINRECGDERLALARFHFRNLAVVQHHAADQLDVEVPHVQDAASSFADYRKSFGENLVQDFLQRVMLFFGEALVSVEIAFLARRRIRIVRRRLVPAAEAAHVGVNALAEFVRLRPQFVVAERLDRRLKCINRRHVRHQRLDDALVLRPKNLA